MFGCAQREDKERAKARKAAGKQAKPLWQEDGKRRSLLDKYDEEEEQMMQVRQRGVACVVSGVVLGRRLMLKLGDQGMLQGNRRWCSGAAQHWSVCGQFMSVALWFWVV